MGVNHPALLRGLLLELVRKPGCGVRALVVPGDQRVQGKG